MDDSINYEFYHWGPLLTKFQLTEEELNNVRKLSSTAHEDHSSFLAGRVKHQLRIEDMNCASIWYDVLQKYVEAYIEVAYNHWYKDINQALPKRDSIGLGSPLWINHMYAGDYNPIHQHSGQLSFVLWTEIPDGIYDDLEKNGNAPPPGSIEFRMGTTDGSSSLKPIMHQIICPQPGELVIFPTFLSHTVYAFNVDGVRKSISGNILYDETI